MHPAEDDWKFHWVNVKYEGCVCVGGGEGSTRIMDIFKNNIKTQ